MGRAWRKYIFLRNRFVNYRRIYQRHPVDSLSIAMCFWKAGSAKLAHMKKERSNERPLAWIRRRPTLPGRFQPSTISVLRLNFCVRYGNRWIPQAIITGNSMRLLGFALHQFSLATLTCLLTCYIQLCSSAFLTHLPHLENYTGNWLESHQHHFNWPLDQALDRLVSSSSIRYRTSTDDLSTSSSLRGLTCF